MGTTSRLVAGATVAGALAGALAYGRRKWLTLGATWEEAAMPLPGDDIIPEPQMQATRARTIEAPREVVWPWLGQMGHGRAGWYGFDSYDNAGHSSAEELRSDIAPLQIGDKVDDATGPFSFTVIDLKEHELLAFRATIHPITGRPVDLAEIDHDNTDYPGAYLDFSWVFVLLPAGEETRLLIRVRYRHSPAWWVYAMVEAYELVDAIFTSRSLRGIERRAEGRVRPTAVPSH